MIWSNEGKTVLKYIAWERIDAGGNMKRRRRAPIVDSSARLQNGVTCLLVPRSSQNILPFDRLVSVKE
jgi:hypothetical protein